MEQETVCPTDRTLSWTPHRLGEHTLWRCFAERSYDTRKGNDLGINANMAKRIKKNITAQNAEMS